MLLKQWWVGREGSTFIRENANISKGFTMEQSGSAHMLGEVCIPVYILNIYVNIWEETMSPWQFLPEEKVPHLRGLKLWFCEHSLPGRFQVWVILLVVAYENEAYSGVLNQSLYIFSGLFLGNIRKKWQFSVFQWQNRMLHLAMLLDFRICSMLQHTWSCELRSFPFVQGDHTKVWAGCNSQDFIPPMSLCSVCSAQLTIIVLHQESI